MQEPVTEPAADPSPRNVPWSDKSAGGKALEVAVWILTALVALGMIGPGVNKLSGPEVWAERFAGWGLPGLMVLPVGLAEAVGGSLLLVPRLARFGGALIVAVMLGAVSTHLFNGETVQALSPASLGTIAALIAWYRR